MPEDQTRALPPPTLAENVSHGASQGHRCPLTTGSRNLSQEALQLLGSLVLNPECRSKTSEIRKHSDSTQKGTPCGLSLDSNSLVLPAVECWRVGKARFDIKQTWLGFRLYQYLAVDFLDKFLNFSQLRFIFYEMQMPIPTH